MCAGADHLSMSSTEIAGRKTDEEIDLLEDLRGALGRGELSLMYQPIVDLTTGAVVSVEALMRWHHPALGTLLPERFILLAEYAGLIESMGAWALRSATAQLVEWQQRLGERAPATICVNISWRELAQDGFVADVAAILDECGLPAEHLVLEIGESDLTRDRALARERVAALKALGVSVAVDDFGLGYSYLNDLAELPFDVVKIDGSAIADVPVDSGNSLLATTICTVIDALGSTTVIEGIERTDQLAFFQSVGGLRGQGYRLTGPLDPPDFATHLEHGTRGIHLALVVGGSADPVVRHLEALGVGCTVAEDVWHANGWLRRTSYDLVVVDLLDDHESGWQLIEMLRADPDRAATPVVVLAHLDDEETAARARTYRCAHLAIGSSPDAVAAQVAGAAALAIAYTTPPQDGPILRS